MRLLELLERRAAVLELVSEALEPRRPVVHVGPEVGGGQLHAVSLVGATYGIRSTPLGAVGLVGPLRMDYEKAIRTCGPPPSSSPGSSKTSTKRPEPSGDRGEGLLRASRRVPNGERLRHQAPSARWRAPSGRLERLGRGTEIQRGRRGVRGAVRSGAASDVRPVRKGGSQARRLRADVRRLRQPDGCVRRVLRRGLSGWRAGRQRPQRGGDVQAVVEIDLEDAFTGLTVSVPLDVALPCDHCGASGAEPGTAARACPTCSGMGVVRTVSQNIFGQFVQQRACPDCEE